jgi:uncharacterized membrane protein YdjX (TVP38/TMEM64 family)
MVCYRPRRLMPFVATSYLLGLSAISLRDYMLGILAALPALLGYVLLGYVSLGPACQPRRAPPRHFNEMRHSH